jgi:hypothetical protein
MKKLIILVAVAVLLAGCTSEYQLDKSVYIYDEEFTDLPAYTEWGYNTFGAYYDRNLFISSGTIPAKVICNNGKTAFSLIGEYTHNGYTDEMTLKFVLDGYSPAAYPDLVSLNDSIIDLSDPGCMVCMAQYGTEDTLQIINGELNFKRVQHLYVDKKSVEAILSGYFHFQFLIDGVPSTISNGRFDVGIGYDNFYAF